MASWGHGHQGPSCDSGIHSHYSLLFGFRCAAMSLLTFSGWREKGRQNTRYAEGTIPRCIPTYLLDTYRGRVEDKPAPERGRDIPDGGTQYRRPRRHLPYAIYDTDRPTYLEHLLQVRETYLSSCLHPQTSDIHLPSANHVSSRRDKTQIKFAVRCR